MSTLHFPIVGSFRFIKKRFSKLLSVTKHFKLNLSVTKFIHLSVFQELKTVVTELYFGRYDVLICK